MTASSPGESGAASSGAAKSRLREEVRARLRAMTPPERTDASARIAAVLLGLPEFASAGSILLYVPIAREPDLRGAIESARKRGARILLPRSRREPATIEVVPLGSESLKELRPDELGVPAPGGPAADPAAIELAIVPGLAFDGHGGRLGRGGGYYDRLLALLPASARTIGVCFERQVVATVPRDAHDRCVDRVVHESGPLQPSAPPHR